MTRKQKLDILGVAGFGTLSLGLWLAAPWVSLSVAGALMLAGSILGLRR